MIAALLLLGVVGAPPDEVRIRAPGVPDDPRSLHAWVFSGELGWNGLAGVGLTVARHLGPHATLEAGLGLSPAGGKVGLRGRYNFSVAEWTPFVAAGFLYAAGNSDGQVETTAAGGAFTYSIQPSPFLQLVGGMEYQSMAGFNFMFCAGYARLLKHNIDILAGNPTEDDLAGIRIATGSGPVLSLSWGYAF